MKCDFCEAPAVANYQKVWVRFAVDEAGDYGLRENSGWWDSHINDDPSGDDNAHLCAEHEGPWLAGDI